MTHPQTIEKRTFSCPNCDYSAKVYGETYFDYGCHNYMATFECKNCQVLFENLISQLEMDEEEIDAIHNLADEFICLQCGKDEARLWSREKGKCPKCGSAMKYRVDGEIRLKY
jgi:transcription elongation factor Elf1